jgi:hypothetical protein
MEDRVFHPCRGEAVFSDENVGRSGLAGAVIDVKQALDREA